MPQFLLELFQEEIPARMQAQAADDLKRLLTRALDQRGLKAATATAYVTPRRLTLVIDDLPSASAAVREELKGPRTSAPDAALAGFLKKTGLTKDQLTIQADPKGDVYLAVIERPGRPAADIIPEAVIETINNFPWPKSMVWAPIGVSWVRPLRSVLCLFDGRTVEFQVGTGNSPYVIVSGNTTRGHRQMANEPFEVQDFEDYRNRLAERRVVLDREDRKAMIVEQAHAAAARAGLVFRDDPELLEEVAGLVEYPVVLTAAFDPAFLDVPQEVLISTMRKNQKYFALVDEAGKLAEKFLIVSNLEARDGGTAIIAGNEKVVRARLSDAKFFWDLDRKTTLDSRLEKLKDIVFHAKLGSQWDRVQRIERLAGEIAERIGADVEQAKLAARLCKADLVSGTVQEFPEVQGIIGGYLAKAEGLPDAVATAIAEHYKPQGPTDSVPNDKVAIAAALADKLDTLVGFFAIDEKPTGSKDPFALRRAAIGCVRIVISSQIRLELASICAMHSARLAAKSIFTEAFEPFKKAAVQLERDSKFSAALSVLDMASDKIKAFPDEISNEMLEGLAGAGVDAAVFILERATAALVDRGLSNDAVTACLFDSGSSSDLVLLVRRVEALQAFLATDDGANLLAGYKRAANILRIEEKKDGAPAADTVDPTLLTAPEEKSLSAAIDAAAPRIEQAIAAEDFAAAMTALAALRAPVDAFFESVKVNDDDRPTRANRLALLARIKHAAHLVADFSRIEG
jgi:glycyl-tRNA synthetase beta chain